MVIHTKEKAKIHFHEPKGARIKGRNIYTVERGSKIAGAKAAGHIEGDAKTGWVLIDLGDIVVSVFGHDERGHFNLEKLWSDAPMVDISGFMAE